MIPITKHSITAVAALIYNLAYDQDAGCGWLADETLGIPGDSQTWEVWSGCLLAALSKYPEASDEVILAQAKTAMLAIVRDHAWDMLHMGETEDGDQWSTMTGETAIVMPLVRDFLEHPTGHAEEKFLEDDPEFLAYLEMPIVQE